MKKAVLVAVVLVLALGATLALAERGKIDFKVGEEYYVCNCGPSCPCDAISRNPGVCACSMDQMVKAKVTQVGPGTVTFKAEGWKQEQTFKSPAKYNCACPSSCDCGTISQTPGVCTCGKKMKKL